MTSEDIEQRDHTIHAEFPSDFASLFYMHFLFLLMVALTMLTALFPIFPYHLISSSP